MEKKIKLKTRSKFSALDLQYEARYTNNRLSGCVLNNIYDITPRCYLLKLGRTNQRENLLIDSGTKTKMYLTNKKTDNREKPNKFTQKLRKHLKGLFLDSILQIGAERVLKLTFTGADKMAKEFIFKIYIEFYSQGNMILTDHEDKILACLRDHEYSETEKVALNEIYPLHKAVTYYIEDININEEAVKKLLENKKKKIKNNYLLNRLVPCAHQLICDIYLVKNKINPIKAYNPDNNTKFIEIGNEIKALYQKQEIKDEDDIKDNLKGYLYSKKDNEKSFEFSPVPLPFKEIYGDEIVEKVFPLFDDAIEHYFTQFDIKRSPEEVNKEIEEKALKKYEKIKKDQGTRLKKIEEEVESLLERVKLVEDNKKEIQGIIDIVHGLMNIGISNIMKDSIEQGKKEGDELALMIEDVKSDKMKAVVRLKKLDDDDNFVEDVLVTIDLNLSAALNINSMYENRKKLIEKGKKTKVATEEALKNAKNLAISEIKNKKLQFKKKQFQKNRKSLWFEKFYWFITSENYLVISARDAQQNEIIIKKYMEKDDVVFHAQIQGSAFTVIKNYTKKPISPISLNETAVAALAHSKAWKLKVIHPVYWIYSHQVSKTAPSGLSLPTGSFMIYGKKNFINPFKLEMG